MSSNVERRIAERGPVGPIPVTVRATERRRGLLGGLRESEVTESAYLVDLSVSGASIVVREIKGMVVRSPIEVSRNGHTASAVVRRIVPRSDGRVMYGIRFESMDPAMQDLLFSLVAARRLGAVEPHGLQAP